MDLGRNERIVPIRNIPIHRCARCVIAKALTLAASSVRVPEFYLINRLAFKATMNGGVIKKKRPHLAATRCSVARDQPGLTYLAHLQHHSEACGAAHHAVIGFGRASERILFDHRFDAG